jgi:hypothetical protein
MPEACFQHGERELRLPSTLVPSARSIFRRSGNRFATRKCDHQAGAGKVRSCAARRMGWAAERMHGGCSGSCRRHAFSMRGSASVEVRCYGAGVMSRLDRRNDGSAGGVLPKAGKQQGRIPEFYPRPLPTACRSAPRAVPNAWKRGLSAAL